MKKQQEAVKILIFGGTTEGRRAAGYLAAAGDPGARVRSYRIRGNAAGERTKKSWREKG